MSTLPQTSMVQGNSYPSQFLVKHEYGDFLSNVQRNMPRIGEVGAESDDFKDRAYKQFHNHDFKELAELQDKFIATDPRAGTIGREKNRNLNRMEYDMEPRHDRKSKEDVAQDVNEKTEMTVTKIMSAFKDHGWTVNATASAVGNKPITQKDYKGQYKI